MQKHFTHSQIQKILYVVKSHIANDSSLPSNGVLNSGDLDCKSLQIYIYLCQHLMKYIIGVIEPCLQNVFFENNTLFLIKPIYSVSPCTVLYLCMYYLHVFYLYFMYTWMLQIVIQSDTVLYYLYL